MQFGPPHWYKCGYEVIEYEVEHDYDIVRVLPRDPLKAARSHLRAYQLKNKYDAARTKRRERLSSLQRSDVAAMVIEQDLYLVNPYGPSWDVPTGKRMALCSKHVKLPWEKYGPYGGRIELGVVGRDPDSWDKAREELRIKAESAFGITKEQFDKLPKVWRR